MKPKTSLFEKVTVSVSEVKVDGRRVPLFFILNGILSIGWA